MPRPDAGDATRADRPSLGAVMKEAFQVDGWRRQKDRDIRPLRRLLPFVRDHWTDAGLGFVFLVLSTGSLLALTGGARTVLDQGFELHTRAALSQIFLWLAAGAAVLAATTGLRIYFLYKLGERVVADLRQAVFRHVLGLDQAHFLQVKTGEVLSRMTTDMTIVENTVGNVIPVALRNSLALAGSLTLMVVISPNFTGLVLVLIPLFLTPLFLIGRRMQRLSVRAQDCFAEAIGYAGEGLGALETIQAFGQEDFVSARFDASIESAFNASRAHIRTSGLMSGLMISLIFTGMLILLFQSAVAVLVDKTMSSGALLQLLILAMVAASALKDLSEVWAQIQKASGAAERIAGMIDATPTIAAPAKPHAPAFAGPGRGPLRQRPLRLSWPAGDGRAAGVLAKCGAGRAGRAGGPVRRWQDHRLPPAASPL